MKKDYTRTWLNILLLIAVMNIFLGYQIGLTKVPEPFMPSQILRFKPVYEGSDPNDVRIAQAELCRHGIDVKIDGDCGKNTALGMCEFLVKIQNGYKVHTMFERNPQWQKRKSNQSRN